MSVVQNEAPPTPVEVPERVDVRFTLAGVTLTENSMLAFAKFSGLFIRELQLLTVIAQPAVGPLPSSRVRALNDRVRRAVLDLYCHAPTLMAHTIARQTSGRIPSNTLHKVGYRHQFQHSKDHVIDVLNY